MRPLLIASSCLLVGCASSHSSMRMNTSAESTSGGPLIAAYHVQPVCNGITTTRDGRAFVCFPQGGVASVCEIAPDGTLAPYPDVKTHAWKLGDGDARDKIVRANSIRVRDGVLWIVDVGSPAEGTPVVPGGPKLVGVDVATNHIVKTYPLDAVVKPKSFVDDVRFGDRMIYLTDAGVPAMIVLDPKTGGGRRVLEDHPSTVARDMYAEGKLLRKPDGEKVATHADQLEVTADGSLLYFMPCSGPSYSIETKCIDDASLSSADLSSHVRPFYDNPTIGGTCIDADGNVYFDDVDHQRVTRVTRVTPAGKATTIVEDKQRLQWGDAMWIDDTGFLWIPAAQLNRSAGMNDGIDHVAYPVTIFKMNLNARPVRR